MKKFAQLRRGFIVHGLGFQSRLRLTLTPSSNAVYNINKNTVRIFPRQMYAFQSQNDKRRRHNKKTVKAAGENDDGMVVCLYTEGETNTKLQKLTSRTDKPN